MRVFLEVSAWQSEWPKEPGWYWFYGYLFGGEEKKILIPVEVFRGQNGMVYSARSHFMWSSEGTDGIWQRIEMPEIPMDDNAA